MIGYSISDINHSLVNTFQSIVCLFLDFSDFMFNLRNELKSASINMVYKINQNFNLTATKKWTAKMNKTKSIIINLLLLSLMLSFILMWYNFMSNAFQLPHGQNKWKGIFN